MAERRRWIGAVLAVSAGALAVTLPLRAAESAFVNSTLDPVIDALHLLDRHYYEVPDWDEVSRGGIDGLLEALDDPYTVYIPAEDRADFDKAIQGRFVGIGAQVRTLDGYTLIVSPLPGSPALEAGVQADDLVVAVDGESVYGMPLQTLDRTGVISKLTGEPGTKVRLTIEREAELVPAGSLEASVPGDVELEDGETAPGPEVGRVRFDVEVTRRQISTPTVLGLHRDAQGEWTYMIDPDERIAYARVTQFTGKTIPEMRELGETLVDRGLRGMILDLRFNSGGALNAALAMSDMFIDDGVVVSVRGRGVRDDEYRASSQGTLEDFPMIVLVNGESASASEIVAGALADNDRAIILGERSFGKGLVQGVYPLPSGAGQIKLTQARYYLPSGRLIQREDDSTEWGVDPTPGFVVPMTNAEYREMIEMQREEEILRPQGQVTPGDWNDPEWILEHMKDPQLAAAVKALRTKLQSGEWVPQGLDVDEGTSQLNAKELARLERSRDLALRQLDVLEQRIAALGTVTADRIEDSRDLWDDAQVVEGGKVRVYDPQGNVIATLRVTGDTLEQWLADAPVELDSDDVSDSEAADDTDAAGEDDAP